MLITSSTPSVNLYRTDMPQTITASDSTFSAIPSINLYPTDKPKTITVSHSTVFALSNSSQAIGSVDSSLAQNEITIGYLDVARYSLKPCTLTKLPKNVTIHVKEGAVIHVREALPVEAPVTVAASASSSDASVSEDTSALTLEKTVVSIEQSSTSPLETPEEPKPMVLHFKAGVYVVRDLPADTKIHVHNGGTVHVHVADFPNTIEPDEGATVISYSAEAELAALVAATAVEGHEDAPEVGGSASTEDHSVEVTGAVEPDTIA